MTDLFTFLFQSTKILMLIVAGFMAGLVLITPAQAQEPPPDIACKRCHVGSEQTFTLPSGQTVPVGIDLDTLDGSIHGAHLDEAVYCTDCHQDEQRYQYPHEPNPAQNLEEFADLVSKNCEACHEPAERHNPGHVLAWENPNVPSCANCHGGHNVEPAETLLTDGSIAFCQSCHQSYADPQIGAVHEEVVANLGPDQTCRTCHGDTEPFPPDETCKTCHNLLQSKLTLESGDTISLHVNPEIIEQSVHGERQVEEYDYRELLCTDCHRDQARYGFPHEPVAPPDARRFTIEMSNLCQECHPEVFDRQQDSTHADALAAGNINAATCADCHGGHDIQVPDEPRGRISQTCAQCHAAINEQYADSVHGAALLGENNPDVPVCIDCHGVHDIDDPTTALFRNRSPELCAGCHADKDMMSQYDISTEVFETYVSDFHGTTVQLFEKQSPDQETNKAVCYDCHGVHDILPATDEHSHIMKENLLATCRQCHPDATANFADAWMSHFRPSLEHNPLIYLVDLFYIILIPAVLGGFLLFISTDIYRRVMNTWRNKNNEEAA